MRELLNIGQLTLIEIIASGSIGEVWRGIHRRYRYRVAIKKLNSTSPYSVANHLEFKHELEILKNLSHPGIITIYDLKATDKTPLMVMELADSSCADAPAIRTWSALRDLLLQVLQTLGYLHTKHIIHCDIKPSNILRFNTFHPSKAGYIYKLIDFGIARRQDESAPSSRSQIRHYQGSPAYSAPEQILGEFEKFGPWTDLYALGSTAYELAAGHPPFSETQFIPLTQRHLDDSPAPIHPRFATPNAFNHWLEELMHKDPSKRFQTAHSAARALLELPQASPPFSSPTSYRRRP